MACSRREFYLLLGSLAAYPAAASSTSVLPSEVYDYKKLPVRAEGRNEFRPVLEGDLHNGCYVEVHQTRLAPGGMPHPPHHHAHEEMFLVRRGTLEVTINGRSSRIGPGSVAFMGSNDEHGIRNPGPDDAEYFVVALGKDA